MHQPLSDPTTPATAGSSFSSFTGSWQSTVLFNKNKTLYFRNKKILVGEVFTTVIYLAVLAILASTVEVQINPADPSTWSSYMYGNFYGVQQEYSYLGTYGCNAFTAAGRNCTDGSWDPGNLGFSDSAEGCSPELTSFMNSLDVCQPGQESLQIPPCVCVPLETMQSYYDIQANNLSASFEFHNTSNLGDFTVHLPNSGLPNKNPSGDSLNNPLNGATYNNGDIGTWGPLLSLLSPIYNGLLKATSGGAADFNFNLRQMGGVEWEQTANGAMTNFPLYVAILFSISVSTIVAEIMNERDKKLDAGLYMSGVTASAYYSSWLQLASLRMGFTVVLCWAFTITMFVPYTSPIISLLVFTLMGYFSILVGVSFASQFCQAKQALNILIWSTILLSAPHFVQYGALFDKNAEAIIPGSVVIILALCIPQFAMVEMLLIMLLRNNSVDNGVQFSNLFTTTSLEVSFGQIFLCFLFNGVGVATLVFYRCMRISGGVQSSNTAMSDEVIRANPPPADVAVSVRYLSKSFGELNAVDGLSVDFKYNQITSFLGHNGAGKTTSIELLTGLMAPNSGDAVLCGSSIVHDMNSIRKNIAVCPQNNVLWDTLSCEEHIKLWYGIKGETFEDPDIVETLRSVGLEDKRDTKASDLSGGQKRKLQVALAFVGNSKVIFLDEPTAGMDTQARRDIWAMLKKKKEGRAIILTTHFMDEADILGDKISILDKGKLQIEGTSSQLKAQFSTGNHLVVSVGSGADRRQILKAIQKVGGGAEETSVKVSEDAVDQGGNVVKNSSVEDILTNTLSGDFPLLIPSKASASMGAICRVLDGLKASKKFEVQAVRGVRDSDVAQYVDNCLRNSNLSDHADKKCGVYSGGNKRKLCFAIAICGNPKLTVLDEASAGIDPAARRKLWNVVTGLLKSGNTVILTTHHMEEAAHLGHRIVIMCDGKLACLGSPLHLQTAYGAGYEVAVQMKDGKAFAPVLEKLNALKRDGDFATLEQAGESYVRVGLGDVDEQGFSLADVFDLLQKEKGGDVESFSVSQSGLEEVFLALTKSRANRDVV